MRKTTFTYLMAVALIATNAAVRLHKLAVAVPVAGAAELLQAAQLAGLVPA